MDQNLENDLALKTQVYRDKFRENIVPKNYIGPLHLLFNGSLLIISIVFHLSYYKSPTLIDLIPYPLMLILGNIAVFLIHRYPLHGFYKWNAYPYKNHTRRHHVFFTEHAITYKNRRDWFSVFFPPEIVVGFLLVYHPFFYFLLTPIIGEDATRSYLIASSGYFILYEVVHYISHLPSTHPTMKIAFFRRMRRHHQLHHSPQLMGKYNFCIVHPFFDMVMGTFVDDQKYTELTGKPAPDTGDTDV